MRVAGHNDQCQCSECSNATNEPFYDPSATYNPNQMMMAGLGVEIRDSGFPPAAAIRREMTLSGGIQLTPIEQGIIDARFDETSQPRGPDGRWITDEQAIATISGLRHHCEQLETDVSALKTQVSNLEDKIAFNATKASDLVAGQRRELDELFATQRDALAAMRTELQGDLSSVLGALEDLKAERTKAAKR